jgi:hypothetical protein
MGCMGEVSRQGRCVGAVRRRAVDCSMGEVHAPRRGFGDAARLAARVRHAHNLRVHTSRVQGSVNAAARASCFGCELSGRQLVFSSARTSP